MDSFTKQNTHMATMMLINVLILIRIGVQGQTSISDALCKKFLLKITDEYYPHKVIEGVFTMQEGEIKDGFPIYSKDNIFYFYYHTFDNEGYIAIGNTLKGFVMIAQARYKPSKWPIWLNEGDRVDPFQNFLSKWFVYDATEDTTVRFGRHGSVVKITCVDDSFVPCASGRLYFNKIIKQSPSGLTETVISIPEQVYFEEMFNVMWNGRSVFQMVGGFPAYMFYSDGYWLVGPDYQTQDAFIRCSDRSFRPEFVDCQWELYTDGHFHYQEGLGLHCRGIKPENDTNIKCSSEDTESPCLQNSPCGNNSLGEIVCFCDRGYRGSLCEQSVPSCPPSPSSSFLTQGNLMSDTSANLCNRGTEPKYVWSKCLVSDGLAYWETNGHECKSVTTTTHYQTTYSTQKSPKEALNLDDYKWIEPFIITMACILQLVLPFMIWCCGIMRQHTKAEPNAENPATSVQMHDLSKKEQHKRRTELDARASNTFSDWADELKSFSDQHPELENIDIKDYPEDAKMELVAINEKYRGLCEEVDKERKELDPKEVQNQDQEENGRPTKNPWWKTASLSRIFSIDFCISMWLWISFLSACGATKCGQYGSVFGSLLTFSFVMIPLSYIFVLMESKCSRENQYLKTMGDAENAKIILNKMRETCPVVIMTAEAWHMESRTRTVSYTDSRGNTQYRTEIYWVKVTSHFITRVFKFGFWTDHSGTHIEGIRKVGVTKIKMDLDIAFGDTGTMEAFESEYSSFKSETMYLDVNVDHNHSMQLPGFKKRVATFMDRNTVPKWMKRSVFWVATIFGFTWFFRIAFQRSVGSSTYSVQKKIYLNLPVEVAADALNQYIDQSQQYIVDQTPDECDTIDSCSGHNNPSDMDQQSKEMQSFVRLSL